MVSLMLTKPPVNIQIQWNKISISFIMSFRELTPTNNKFQKSQTKSEKYNKRVFGLTCFN